MHSRLIIGFILYFVSCSHSLAQKKFVLIENIETDFFFNENSFFDSSPADKVEQIIKEYTIYRRKSPASMVVQVFDIYRRDYLQKQQVRDSVDRLAIILASKTKDSSFLPRLHKMKWYTHLQMFLHSVNPFLRELPSADNVFVDDSDSIHHHPDFLDNGCLDWRWNLLHDSLYFFYVTPPKEDINGNEKFYDYKADKNGHIVMLNAWGMHYEWQYNKKGLPEIMLAVPIKQKQAWVGGVSGHKIFFYYDDKNRVTQLIHGFGFLQLEESFAEKNNITEDVIQASAFIKANKLSVPPYNSSFEHIIKNEFNKNYQFWAEMPGVRRFYTYKKGKVDKVISYEYSLCSGVPLTYKYFYGKNNLVSQVRIYSNIGKKLELAGIIRYKYVITPKQNISTLNRPWSTNQIKEE